MAEEVLWASKIVGAIWWNSCTLKLVQPRGFLQDCARLGRKCAMSVWCSSNSCPGQLVERLQETPRYRLLRARVFHLEAPFGTGRLGCNTETPCSDTQALGCDTTIPGCDIHYFGIVYTSLWCFLYFQCSFLFNLLFFSCVFTNKTLALLGDGCYSYCTALQRRTQLIRAIMYQEIGWFDEPDHSAGILTSQL